jgi:hypothetical protein
VGDAGQILPPREEHARCEGQPCPENLTHEDATGARLRKGQTVNLTGTVTRITKGEKCVEVTLLERQSNGYPCVLWIEPHHLEVQPHGEES